MQVLDPVVWERGDGLLSRRHLIAYTGLPPDYAGMQTVCRRTVPMAGRLSGAEAALAAQAMPLCPKCQAQLERHGRAFYERQQHRFTTIDRGRRSAERHEERP